MSAVPQTKMGETDRNERMTRLVARYREPVVRYFVRRGLSRENAEDCAQDVFFRLTRTDDVQIENPEAYLFSIAANVVVDHIRARARWEHRHDPFDCESVPGGEIAPDRIFADREALVRLRAVLQELPDRTREIFLLNRLEGLSYTQLAARYHLSVKSIEKYMSKALSHLRKRFPVEERHQ